MAGYGPVAMVRTPWGDAGRLRDRKLRPGQRLPAEEVARNQRERLFAALVAVVAEKGYEGSRVEDLLELSGVSRSAFYAHFKDKEECLLAALQAFVGPTVGGIFRDDGPPLDEARARAAFETFIRLIVEQSAAARMCLVEIYAAGPRAVEEIDRTIDSVQAFVSATLDRIPGRAEMPPEIVRAMVGGLRKVIHTRLYRDEEEELAELIPPMWDWLAAYTPPPLPLRRPRSHAAHNGGPPNGYDPADRILRALAAVVAEKGYPAMTIGDIAARASISLSTFYANFADKEEAMLAAVDSGSSQMLATTLPAFRRAPDWPHAVRGAFGAMFAFCAAEPDYTTLGAVDVYAAGRRALEQRDQVMTSMEALLVPGFERKPDTSPIAAEAIGGAIYSMIYDQVMRGGAESMQEIAPLATYVTLAPFIGAEEACAVANSEGRGR
ncbi:MAG TPA: TetR/AcrR family transcriptional regulator [Solirubrobacterales bacterium]|jgi:AcrR family transcriptional regulator|nr:TetR/AcrR family transcriptional regulator [Solirubrobacterales bacterium]